MPPMTLPSMFADSKLWGVCVWRGQVSGVKPLRTARPYHFGSCVREKSQRMDSRPGEPRKESKQGPQMEVTSARWSCQVKVGEGFTLHFDGNNENVGNSAWMQPEPCGLRIQAFLPRQSLKQTKQNKNRDTYQEKWSPTDKRGIKQEGLTSDEESVLLPHLLYFTDSTFQLSVLACWSWARFVWISYNRKVESLVPLLFFFWTTFYFEIIVISHAVAKKKK